MFVYKGIIRLVYNKLKHGAPAAFISKHNIERALDKVGFIHSGECRIPPKTFLLPRSRKGANKRDKNMGTSNCYITFVTKI